MAKKKKWIQAASASIKKRGTEGVCTGPKFGGPTCPPGSKRYNLAKVFKGMAKKKKKAAWGSMIHAKKSKYIQGTASTKDLLKNFNKIISVLPPAAKKPGKKATGAMIHAKDSKYIRYKDDALGGTPDRPGRHPPVIHSSEKKKDKKKKKWTREEKIKIMTGPIPREFLHNRRILHSDPRMLKQGGILHAKTSKYIQRAKDRHPPSYDLADQLKDKGKSITKKKVKKEMTREEKLKIIHGPLPRKFFHSPRLLHSDPRMLRQGGMLKAKTSAFAETHAANWAKRRAASTTGMKVAGAGTAYKSAGWTTKINKSLNKLKNMMKLGRTTSLAAASKFKGANPSKYLSRAKTLAKTGGRRSLLLMGGPMGVAAAAALTTPSLIEKLTKRAPGATKTKLFGIDLKGAEKSARTREALMAKRNKARNAKTGTMVRAAHGEEVLGKQQVPFTIEPASANLAEQRQGRKGAAVTGFNFKGVF